MAAAIQAAKLALTRTAQARHKELVEGELAKGRKLRDSLGGDVKKAKELTISQQGVGVGVEDGENGEDGEDDDGDGDGDGGDVATFITHLVSETLDKAKARGADAAAKVIAAGAKSEATIATLAAKAATKE